MRWRVAPLIALLLLASVAQAAQPLSDTDLSHDARLLIHGPQFFIGPVLGVDFGH